VYQIVQSSSLRNYNVLVGVPLPEYLSGIVRYGRDVCGSCYHPKLAFTENTDGDYISSS
jgi:hypothetical protein